MRMALRRAQLPASTTAVVGHIPVASKGVNHLDLARILLVRQLKLLSKRTIFGILLPLGIPVILFVLYSFVFHSIFHVGIKRYPVYLFAGLLPWTYLSQTLGVAVSSVSREAELVRRAKFPYVLLPMAATGAGLVFLLITLVGFIIVLAVTGPLNPVLLPLLVLPILAVYLFVTGIALFLSVIDVFNRDLRLLLANVITIWFFIVPVAYSQSTLSRHVGFLTNDDPITDIVGDFREILYWRSVGGLGRTAAMMVLCAGFFLVSVLVFRRTTRDLAKNV
jgi:lipopolysaccharide transport system permease protein